MSIKGKIKNKITKEIILELITEYDIYYRFFGEFKLNKICCNHLRGEKTPSFIIGTKFGIITHKDMGDSNWKGNCFNLVQQIYSCSLNEALKIIDCEFNLEIEKGNFNKIIIPYKQPIIEKHKEYSKIQVITKKFNKEELHYWNTYCQDIEDLKKENIFSIKEIYLNKEKFFFNNLQLKFGYYYPEEEKWKIYFPFENSYKKWISNIPLTYLESKENINNCETAWITKSKKDKMVLNKLYPNVCSVQNESIGCFNENNIKYLKENSEKQILLFDSDAPGVKNSKIVTQKFNMGYFNIPKGYLSDGINDSADLVKEYGLNTLEKLLKRKKLL